MKQKFFVNKLSTIIVAPSPNWKQTDRRPSRALTGKVKVLSCNFLSEPCYFHPRQSRTYQRVNNSETVFSRLFRAVCKREILCRFISGKRTVTRDFLYRDYFDDNSFYISMFVILSYSVTLVINYLPISPISQACCISF
jgi:hypothetical protein